MEDKVLKTIKKYNLIQENDSIVIGVSGGPDSLTLLEILNKLKNKLNIKIYVAHINHMLRKEADEETEYVKEFCKNRDIQCFVKKVDVLKVSKDLKKGTEETGRNIRYEFFEEVLKLTNSNKIAIAHNSNDNAETVIMNVLRGSGISGLKGIEPMRDNKFIRPIIECTREEIEQYCRENKLNPKYDKSNLENVYTRNKIRNIVIPYIKEEFNPNIITTLNRLSDIATDESEYLEKQAIKEYKNILIQENKDKVVLNLKEFNDLDKVIRKRVIMKSINNVVGSIKGIEKIHIEDIIKVCERNIGNKYLTPNKNIRIFVKNGKIEISKI